MLGDTIQSLVQNLDGLLSMVTLRILHWSLCCVCTVYVSKYLALYTHLVVSTRVFCIFYCRSPRYAASLCLVKSRPHLLSDLGMFPRMQLTSDAHKMALVTLGMFSLH